VFTVFVDSLWFNSISSEWMPYLIDNNLLTIDQKNLIDKKISEWKSVVKPTDITWLYAIVALVVIILIVLFIIKRKKTVNNSPPMQNTNN
jgi:fucose permease